MVCSSPYLHPGSALGRPWHLLAALLHLWIQALLRDDSHPHYPAVHLKFLMASETRFTVVNTYGTVGGG